ncbi:3-deoxy-manno-octulosonate cytidylyltransferase [Spirosoma utsteinense]|uniref:3-deoxy-manno-octulosonate cytidylyltransferase n=1 Tax=Spirosoma utsteinense TaxID=2585773 RepID=A0ABR6W3D6_9BACT|nr:3-deoxy-manno-octulosonate cytidylyltransferase [Spirosoma utsteinense]MBC3786695.1 3-deoxy-manno-octulosonate cytidylyltransferase (CMP-KDO synthetase) [Spirosoma utsteinense]MBC3791058.1 3-deoxy-manno-octulosonate cytidylyltransferase (CMP-KDO synthetase) [Spirosoma utsteinense]
MVILGIIPARYASTRFPAKALVDINGKSMIQRVVEQARQALSLSRVVVATDDERIRAHVADFGGEVVMTSLHHQSGTDRCQEALQQLGVQADYVVNIQGDEPFIQPRQIDMLTSVLDGVTELATLVKVIDDPQTLQNPNTPKVVLSATGEALYFSRQPIPYLRGQPLDAWLASHTYYKHIGLYAYRTDVLAQLTQLPPSLLEKAESLEQLRWLENGYRIRTVITDLDSHGIDTPEDLETVKQLVSR